MSVPESYSVAADSGFPLHLQEEEQYHNQHSLYHQQQYQQEQQQFFALDCSSDEEFRYQQHRELLMQQQQQEQLQSSVMASTASSCNPSPILSDHRYNEMMMMTESLNNIDKGHDDGSMAAVVTGDGISGNDDDEWMMLNGGRLGIPGAARRKYQNENCCMSDEHQLLQQHPAVGPSLIENNNEHNGENATSSSDDLPSTSSSKQPIVNGTTQQEMRELLENELHSISSEELYNILKEYDALQEKFHTILMLPKESKREVTAGGRDGSAYILRCLKMWYELPSDVLFAAMSMVDRFLDRMTVRPKHMACMSVASFFLAVKQLGLKPIPAEDLVKISQCGCTPGDLERMAGIIENKLGIQMGFQPITAVKFLRIFYALFRNMAKELSLEFFNFYTQMIKLEELENRLENLLCDVKTNVITPSTMSLVLLCLHLDFHIRESYMRGSPTLKEVFEFILFLQQYLMIPDRVFTNGFTIVSGILSHYNGQQKQPYKQRLVWRLSSRTLRNLRPTKSFSSDLPTIEEGISYATEDGCRSRTESMSSEEGEDWPTSLVIPIFEQC